MNPSALGAIESVVPRKPKSKESPPNKSDSLALAPRPDSTLEHGSLGLYLTEINRFPLLSRDEELALALKYFKTGDPQAAHRLVTANLRFVVKIAMQYAKYGVKLKDLIQEGNLGLLVAVKKFNPTLGNRLISYAVWWIKAYIQKYLLDSWSMVRLGTTQAQRKIFNSMKKIQRRIMALEGEAPTDKQLAATMEVTEKEVQEMRQRMSERDLSLDAPLDHEGSATRMDLIVSHQDAPDEQLIHKSETELMQRAIGLLRHELNEKEINILEKRLLADEPVTLQEIGDDLKLSRERIRQIEENLKRKLKHTVQALLKSDQNY